MYLRGVPRERGEAVRVQEGGVGGAGGADGPSPPRLPLHRQAQCVHLFPIISQLIMYVSAASFAANTRMLIG